MSKKVVAFTLPPERSPRLEAREVEAPLLDAGSKASTGDEWVNAPKPEQPAATSPAFATSAVERERLSGPGPVVIDLSTPRSPFELMQLVWAFPWIATWHWTLRMMETSMQATRPRA